jgi:hypothetical protein
MGSCTFKSPKAFIELNSHEWLQHLSDPESYPNDFGWDIYMCVSHVFWHARVWKGLDECCGVGAAFPPATLQTSRWVSLLDSNASMTQGTLARLPWATQEQFGNWTWPAKIEAKSISSLITMERRSASTPRSCTWTRQESQGLGIKPSSQESNHLKSKLLQVLGRSSVLAEMTAVRNASSSTTCV